MRKAEKIGIGAIAVLSIVVLFFLYMNIRKTTQASAPRPSASEAHVAADKTRQKEKTFSPVEPVPQEPASDTTVRMGENIEAAASPPAIEDQTGMEDDFESEAIDPVRLAEAELALINNQLYEELARETLPTLSIQTHNPVWALEDEAAEVAGITIKETRTGPFGNNIQPAENEIWLRIPADYAAEHRDIMAENADLYRAETGTNEPITIMLWVGGRPYARHQYE